MRHSKAMGVIIAVAAALSLAACGGGSSSTGTGVGSEQTASVFTVGTDAAFPSVVSCLVTISGVTVNNGSNQVSVLSQAQDVDFAKLSGLHQLVDLQSVPVGSYTSATVTISAATISYIDTTQNPPAISTLKATFPDGMSDTVTFSNPFGLQNADLVGLRMEFDLAKSILTDGTGNITGQIDPTFNLALVNSSDASVTIDDFHAAVSSVVSATQFIVQGPKGRLWTVQTAPTTAVDDPSVPESSYTTNTIVSVSGTLDPVSKDIDATEVQVVSTDNFYMGGLFTSIQPPAVQPATSAGLYIREELPAVNGIEDGEITTLTLNGSEVYRIGNITLPLTTLLFNNSMLAPGQNVDIGGKITTTNGTSTLTVHRVVLRRQGQQGTLVDGSVKISSGNVGSFSFTDKWTAGVLLPAPLTIMTTNQTNFNNISGLTALSQLTGTVPLRVVGYVLVNSQTGTAVLIANSVTDLSNPLPEVSATLAN